MARPLRIQYPGAVYHVMNRGSSRQKVFLENRDYEAFLHTLAEVHDRWQVEVFAYCLMGKVREAQSETAGTAWDDCLRRQDETGDAEPEWLATAAERTRQK